MTGIEIRERIKKNNEEIQKTMNPGIFTLNKRINELLEENSLLRAQCEHSFDDTGYCIYCDKKVD